MNVALLAAMQERVDAQADRVLRRIENHVLKLEPDKLNVGYREDLLRAEARVLVRLGRNLREILDEAERTTTPKRFKRISRG